MTTIIAFLTVAAATLKELAAAEARLSRCKQPRATQGESEGE